MKAKAAFIDCPGISGPNGIRDHSMRDYCWSCAPFWERIPLCPTHHRKLRSSGYCQDCRKFYNLEEDNREATNETA